LNASISSETRCIEEDRLVVVFMYLLS